MPRFLPATRRQRLGQGLGILSYTTGTGFAFLHPGVSPASIKPSIMQSTKTCSPVAPSAFDRRNTTRLNLFHLAGYSSNLQVHVSPAKDHRQLSEWQPLLAAKPRTNHLAFAFEAGLVSMQGTECYPGLESPAYDADRSRHRASKDSHPLSRTLPRRPIYRPPTPFGISGQPLSGRRSSA